MKKIILTAMLAACSMCMQAQFSGQGSGTEKDPYQITNADELFEVRNDLDACYKMMNDVDLTEWIQEETPSLGWSPIGNSTTPFVGVFDGNNKTIKGLYINRKNSSEIGLFGNVSGATIKSFALLNPRVTGNCFVGAAIGRIRRYALVNTTISNVCVIGGQIYGTDAVGGVVGGCQKEDDNNGMESLYNAQPSDHLVTINGCFASSVISGSSNVGGIIGVAQAYYYSYCGSYSWDPCNYWYYFLDLKDNCFYGNVNAIEGPCGGLVGKITDDGKTMVVQCERNIVGGVIKSAGVASGICPMVQAAVFTNNVCVADTICSTSSSAFRITSSTTFTNNYGFNESVIISAGRLVPLVEDDNSNGTGYGKKTLRKQTFYTGLGFNFNTQWSILNNETLPYNISQSAPGQITSFLEGSKASLSGTDPVSVGLVYAIIGNQVYETPILDGKWEMQVGKVKEGTLVKVSVQYENLMPSIFVYANAERAPEDTTKTTGDANGDGMLDTADVTAIINYILGKPSASFNGSNADVNGDGEILIDDAVQTVQLIMDAQ